MMPPLPRSVVRRVLYPTYRSLRRDRVLEVLSELERNQWSSADEIAERQWKRLSSYLREITARVPYYRDLFRQLGLRAEDIRSPADFQKIPMLTKQDIRAAGPRIITEDPARRGLASNTSGSTGEPLYFHCDVAAGPLRRAAALMGYRWAGVDIGDRLAYIWGFHLDRPWKERAVLAVKNYFINRVYLSSFNMSEPALRGYARMLKAFRPDAIDGFPSALAVFAEFCTKHRVSDIKPRVVLSSGEKMYPHQKETLAAAFNCPVFDRYGTNEFSITAQECDRHGGLHLLSEYLYVEVIHESGRPAQSGEIGEIVMTDLSNLYMPFLRYRTGDLAVPTARKCACGRGLPLLDRIEGRAFDMVVTSEGKSAGGFFWTYLSRSVPGIKQFQIEQRDRNGVRFKVVPGPAWQDDYRQDLERRIKENLGSRFRVDFDIVGDIPLTPAGKFRFISSRVGERLVVKSKIHKARVTGADPGGFDCLIVDEHLLELSNLAPYEKVLVVDNDNGSRVETFVVKGRRDSGDMIVSGAAASQIRPGDEIIAMSFTWSEEVEGLFKNILVDGDNRFVRYLVEVAGDKL